MVVDANGLFCQTGDYIVPNGTELSCVSFGLGIVSQLADGFTQASGVAMTASGELFVSDVLQNQIFRLRRSDQSTVLLDVLPFDQRDDPWGPLEYNSASNWAPPSADPTIARWGCTLTSVAMLLRYHGITSLPNCLDQDSRELTGCPELVGLEVDPLSVNRWLLKEPEGYDIEGNVNLYAIQALSKRAGRNLVYRKFGAWDLAILRNEIENGRPAIVELDLSYIGLPGSHFVVVKGFREPSVFLLNDPDLLEAETLAEYGPTHKSIRTFIPTNTDFSAIFLSITPPQDFLLTNSEGERTGFDAVTGYIAPDFIGQRIGISLRGSEAEEPCSCPRSGRASSRYRSGGVRRRSQRWCCGYCGGKVSRR
jgi:hypothetical protein